MALALNNIQRVDMPLNKETKPNQNITVPHRLGMCPTLGITAQVEMSQSTNQISQKLQIHRVNVFKSKSNVPELKFFFLIVKWNGKERMVTSDFGEPGCLYLEGISKLGIGIFRYFKYK